MLVNLLETLQRIASRLSWSSRPSLWLAIAAFLVLAYVVVFAPQSLDRWLTPGILLIAWSLLWYSFVNLFPNAVLRAPPDTEPTAAQRFFLRLRQIGYGVVSLGLAGTAIGLVMMSSRLLNTWNVGGNLDLDVSQAPTTQSSALPHLHRAADGRVVLSWVDTKQDTQEERKRATLKMAVLPNDMADNTWSEAQRVASGSDWFLNWADFPSVIAIDSQRFGAHWLRRSGASTYAYDVLISQSADGGKTWQDPRPPHLDGTASEHGFVSLFASPTGLGAVWLDGRNTLAASADKAMTLRGVQLAANSATNSADGEKDESTLLDARACDCCQTDVATLGETVIVAYRDRSDSEIRDIAVTRRINGAWQPGGVIAKDAWRVNGCPVNGPAIAALRHEAKGLAQDTVVVAWYTEAAGPQVRLALSTNAAASFDNAITVDEHQPIGRVDVEMDDDGSAIVSWVRRSGDAKDDTAELCVRRVYPGGSMEPLRVVARTSASRASGFPQMVRQRDRLVFAWTKTTKTGTDRHSQTLASGITTATVPIGDI